MASGTLIRRRSLRELIDDSARVIEADLLGIAILTAIYYAVLIIMLFALFGSSFISVLMPAGESPGLESTVPSGGELPVAGLIIGLVGLLLATMVYIGGFIWLVASGFSSSLNLNFEGALVLGLRNLPQLIGVALIQIVALGALFTAPLLFAAPPLLFITLPVFIWILIRWNFAFHAVVLEDCGPYTALRRSWELVQDSWLRVFGIILMLMVLYSVLASVVNTIDPSGLIALILTVVLTPIQYIVTTVLYGDLRARFDERRPLADSV